MNTGRGPRDRPTPAERDERVEIDADTEAASRPALGAIPDEEDRGMGAASVAMPDTPPEGWEDFRRAREEIKSGTAKVISLDEALRLIDDKHARQQWLDRRRSSRDV